MNARTTPAATDALQQALKQAASARRTSSFEKPFHQFSDDVIDGAHLAGTNAAPYLRDLNRIAALTAGLGAVLRIVAGNCVVSETHNPDDESSEPPLSRYTINVLTNMAAEVCELISDDIDESADALRKQVKA